MANVERQLDEMFVYEYKTLVLELASYRDKMHVKTLRPLPFIQSFGSFLSLSLYFAE